MEASALEEGMRHLSGVGNTLNVYEITSLQLALMTLQKKTKADKVYFWGRIRAHNDDYYIAFALEESEYIYPRKKMYFSTSQFDFRPLPEGEVNRDRERPDAIVLTGDPTRVIQSPDDAASPAAEAQSDEEEGGGAWSST
ncbi:hypothetical protein, conserved [Eimeria brunetti]|uniref:Radial spoke head protein 9 homolog n=1 Tax=Eimeria brunetti TaxID=51314 RepID=U6LK21_9EIME|nr:hypothetical protein, conserved [Eimeria brunetti]